MTKFNNPYKGNVTSLSSGKTKKIAGEFLRKILKKEKSPLICLYGELGAGKTTFVKGLGDFLHVQKHEIKSPTFVFLHMYKGKKGKLYHFDFYRAAKGIELVHELHEILERKDGVTALEWADKVKDFLPKKRYDVFLEHVSPRKRMITFL